MSVKRESTVVASVVVVGADADIGDSTVDNVAAVVAIVVISVVVITNIFCQSLGPSL